MSIHPIPALSQEKKTNHKESVWWLVEKVRMLN